MITSGQRAKLRSMAQQLTPIFQIGKNGLTENLVNDLVDALEKHELIKISVLKNAEVDTKVMLNAVCEATCAEPVTAIGNKIVIYRFSSRDDINHIDL